MGFWSKLKSYFTGGSTSYTVSKPVPSSSGGESTITPGSTGTGGGYTYTGSTSSGSTSSGYTYTGSTSSGSSGGSSEGTIQPGTTGNIQDQDIIKTVKTIEESQTKAGSGISGDTGRIQPAESTITPGSTGTGGGVYIITPEEEKTVKGKTTLPYWAIQSKTPYEAIDIESKYTGIPVSTIGGAGFTSLVSGGISNKILSTPEQQYNIKMISQSREFSAAELEIYRAEKNYFKSGGGELEYNKYVGAVESYNKILTKYDEEGFLKPEYERQLIISSRQQSVGGLAVGFANVEAGLKQTAIGFGEGIINYSSNLGVKTFQFKEGGIVESKRFSFGSSISNIPTEPSIYTTPLSFAGKTINLPTSPKYFTELITERPTQAFTAGAVGGIIALGGAGAYKNIKSYGVKTGIIETASYFSPLRIQSGVYSPDLNKEFTKTFSAKGNIAKQVSFRSGKETITYTTATTKDFNIYLESIQGARISGDKFAGASFTKLSNVPYAKFLGGKLTFGRTTITSASLFAGVPSSIRGAYDITSVSSYSSDVLGSGISKTYSVAGSKLLTQTPKFQTYLFGGSRYEITGSGSTFDVYKPIPNIKGFGVQFDITPSGTSGFTSFSGGGTKTSFSKTFGIQSQTFSSIVNVPSTQSFSTAKTSPAYPILATGQQSGQGVRFSTEQKTFTLPKINQILPQQETQATRGGSAFAFSSSTILEGRQSTEQKIIPGVITAQGLRSVQIQRSKIGLITPTISTPSAYFEPPSPSNFGGEIILPNFALMSGGFDLPSNIIKGGSRRTGYTPSFSALAFNIGGSYSPQGFSSRSGIDFRPIIPGFQFKTGLGGLKFRNLF